MTNKNSSLIDLNTIDEKELIKKLAISPRQAKRILSLRPYHNIDQLKNIWGIDPDTVQRILLLVQVIPEETPIQPDDKTPILGPAETATPPIIEPEPPAIPTPTIKNISWKTNIALILILVVGAWFRFTGINWDENHHQHPDERYITMVTEQIRGVSGVGTYFDTEKSTLNPLGYGSYTYGMLPLFITRMIAEWAKMDSYDTITLVGRFMSGFFDLAAVWMLFVLGKRLYNKRTGLLAAALGAAAVLPIQLSHYYTVDSFSTIFVIAGFYFALLAVPLTNPKEKLSRTHLKYFALFGFTVGLAGACKVNTLPMFILIILAGFARLLTGKKQSGFAALLKIILAGWVVAIVMAFLAFRIFQPYAFSGPGFFGLELNPRWLEIIREVTDHVAGNSDWPPNHHWTNRPLTYAWSNMVTWGLGLPLGLAGWLGWAWAAWRMWKGDWRRHFLPFTWVAAYFLWQNLQFWRYMRYFMPIYPFIILFAAWALLEFYDRTQNSRERLSAGGIKFFLQRAGFSTTWKGALSIIALGGILIATYGYAIAFTRIYTHPITRITASRWMLENIPGPLNLKVKSPQESRSYPVAVFNRQVVEPGETPTIDIRIVKDGTTSSITSTNVRQVGVSFYFRLTRDEKGEDIISDGRLAVMDNDLSEKQVITFGDINLEQGESYYFHYKIHNSSEYSLSEVALRNETEEDPSLPIDWNMDNQAPGEVEGSIKIMPGANARLNRLEIGQFQQAFIPTETTMRVSIFNDEDDQNPLAATTETMTFSQAGVKFTPTFNFSPLSLSAGKTYKVRYEIINGGPLRLLGDSFTLETGWDDALPLSVDKYDGLGGIYSPLNLELYEPDTPEKREAMIKILSESNYIVIPSNRAYDSMPRLPLRYPMTLKYYQTLFDCDCSGDALEKRAYKLEPPFKSPLGFELVAVFENPPKLGPFTFSDQNADESFTVYDHPKVFIFKKSEDFSPDTVRSLLESVDLEQVVFQNPMAFTKAPTAMQLPSDRLAAQRAGGTWSSMFDRNAFLNTHQGWGVTAWYLSLLLMGWLVFPIVFLAFSGLQDRGYPLVRMVGLIIVAWLAWILGSLKILPFTRLSIGLCIGLILALSIGLAYHQRKALSDYLHSHWKQILGTETIFLVLFLFSLSVRLGNPDLWHPWLGGEKPMDFTFFNAVLKAVYFPPEHPWFSGHYINYYYYGYVLAAIPTKLLGILPSIAYNLILPSWFAMTGIGVFCAAFNLTAGLRNNTGKNEVEPRQEKPLFRSNLLKSITLGKSLPYLAGIFAILAVLFFGNLHMVRQFWFYLPEIDTTEWDVSSPVGRTLSVISGAKQVISGQASLPGDNGRWYFGPSRPILHDGPDTPIAEFPYFTFLYGDMHPHLLNMPFYMVALGWMLGLLLHPFSQRKWGYRLLSLIIAGLVIGSFRASHTWDFPTFAGLGILVIFWDTWRNKTNSLQDTIQTLIGYEVAFIGVAVVLYWPFAQWFRTEYASLELWKGARTPLVDYLFVFGLPLYIMISLMMRDLSSNLKSFYRNWSSSPFRHHLKAYVILLLCMAGLGSLWLSDYQVLVIGIPLLAGMVYLIFFKHGLSMLQRVTWILFAAAFSITFLVEVIVLKGDSGRSNMVFRFYNQAWFLLGLAIATTLVDLLTEFPHWRRQGKWVWLISLGLLILSAASYPLIATGKKMADRWPNIQDPPRTLDGAAFMLGDASSPAIFNDEERLLDLSLDHAGIQYMQDNLSGSPVIVEGNTTEYRWGARYAIHTGLPSVAGWSWHVRQHNSLLDGAIIDKRIQDVVDFYNTTDIESAAKFLRRYQVQYIILSGLERAYYDPEGINKFQKMVDQGILDKVFGGDTPQTATIFKVNDAN